MVATIIERTRGNFPTDEARRSMSEDTFADVGFHDQGHETLGFFLSLLLGICLMNPRSRRMIDSQNQNQDIDQLAYHTHLVSIDT